MNRVARYDGDGRSLAQLRCVGVLLASVAACAAVADPTAESIPLEMQRETIFVRAGEAWQSDDRRQFLLSGDLVIHSAEWEIRADSAALRGALDDPDEIIVDGSPARISVRRNGDAEPFRGSGFHLEFKPRQEVVRLVGEALVRRDRQSISSDSIRYLLKRDTFSSGQGSRVRVVTSPEQH